MILQAIQTQIQQIVLQGVTLLLQEFLEQEVTVKLGRATKKTLMEQAAAVSQAQSASEAHARLLAEGSRWRPTQPQAVAPFEHSIEQTIRSSWLPKRVREGVRSTSLRERTRSLNYGASCAKSAVSVVHGEPRWQSPSRVSRLNAQWAQSN